MGLSKKDIMFFAMTLLGCNLLCLVMDGLWFQAEDVTMMGYLTGMKQLQSASWTAIFVVPYNFFTHAFPRMLLWDYSFLQGALGIVRWFLFILSIGAIWGMGQEFRVTIQSIFGRRG